MKIMKRSWEEVSINDYMRIKEISDDAGLNETERGIAILSVLCDAPEEKIWELSVPEVKSMFAECGWIGSFDYSKEWHKEKMKVGDTKCRVELDVSKMTVAQYVDFQMYYKDGDIAKILSCFLIPEGCKYGEGYDVQDFIERIRDNVSIAEANSICFFFIISSARTIRTMRIYSVWQKNIAETQMRKARKRRRR